MNAFECRGFWWLPKQPNTKLSGVLKFDPNARIVLELLGSFKPPKELGRFGKEEIILGVTADGKEITLYKCVDAGFSIVQSGPMTSKFLARVIFSGRHFQDESELVFESVSIDYTQLHKWTRITGFKSVFSAREDEGIVESVSYTIPTVVSIDVDDTKMSIVHSYSSGGDRIQDISLRQTTFWRIAANKALHYRIYREKLFYHVQNFLTFAMDHPVFPRRIVGKSGTPRTVLLEERVQSAEIEIFYPLGKDISSTDTIDSHEMLFLYQDIADSFQKCLCNWFDKSALLGPVYDLYFGTLYRSSTYLQQEFLALTQALESYHRRVFGGKYLDEEGFAPVYGSLIAAIPNGLAEDFAESLMSKFKYLSEFSLRKRLNELLSDVIDLLPETIKQNGGMVEDIVNTRNYLTHYNESLALQAKTGQELYDLIQSVRRIMQVCLLLELGLPRDIIRSLMEKHARFR